MIVCSVMKGGLWDGGRRAWLPGDLARVMGHSPLSWAPVVGHKHEDLMRAQRENPRTGLTLWVLSVPRASSGMIPP